MTTMREALQTDVSGPAPSGPRFCRDCKWRSPDPCDGVPPEKWVCLNEHAAQPNERYYVSGMPSDRELNYTCLAMRAGICANGLYWQPRTEVVRAA